VTGTGGELELRRRGAHDGQGRDLTVDVAARVHRDDERRRRAVLGGEFTRELNPRIVHLREQRLSELGRARRTRHQLPQRGVEADHREIEARVREPFDRGVAQAGADRLDHRGLLERRVRDGAHGRAVLDGIHHDPTHGPQRD